MGGEELHVLSDAWVGSICWSNYLKGYYWPCAGEHSVVSRSRKDSSDRICRENEFFFCVTIVMNSADRHEFEICTSNASYALTTRGLKLYLTNLVFPLIYDGELERGV